MAGDLVVWVMNGVMNSGGTESFIMDLFRHAGGRIHYVMVVHTVGADKVGTWDDEIRRLGIPIVYLPSVGSVGIKAYGVAVRELIDRIGVPDVLHSHVNAVGGLIAKVAAENGVQHRIVHCHADILYTGSWASRWLSEVKLQAMRVLCNRYGNHYWACSQPAADRLFYANKEKIVIKNMITVEDYLFDPVKRDRERVELGLAADAVVLGSVGRIALIKNYELALEVLAALRRSGGNYHWVCYGRVNDVVYFESLQELSVALGVEAAVHWLGDSQRIADQLAAFDCFLMPSHTEGFGIAALEAQAVGLPCFVSTGVPQDVDLGLGLVRFMDPGSVADWVDAVLHTRGERPSDQVIVDAFLRRGRSAADTVADIEREYLEMAGDRR